MRKRARNEDDRWTTIRRRPSAFCHPHFHFPSSLCLPFRRPCPSPSDLLIFFHHRTFGIPVSFTASPYLGLSGVRDFPIMPVCPAEPSTVATLRLDTPPGSRLARISPLNRRMCWATHRRSTLPREGTTP